MCEEKRVSNVLYTMCNMSLESNATSRLAHMTEPRSQGKHSIFLLTMKSIGIFRDFMIDSAQTLILYRILLVFSLDIMLSLLALEAMPTINDLNPTLSLVNV